MTAPVAFIDRVEQGLDNATKAVLDLAFARQDMGAEAFARVIALHYGEHAPTVEQIATDLTTALDLRTDPPTQVLARHGIRHATDALRVCDAMAEEKETDAVRAAQLVASLIVRGAAA